MAQSAKDLLSKSLSTLKVDGNTRTISGSFSTSAGDLIGLTAGHSIQINDKLSFSHPAPAYESGLNGVSDATTSEAGTGLLRINKTNSLFVTLGEVQAAFSVGKNLYFETGGFLSGAVIQVKASPLVGNVTAIDGSLIGESGHWIIIFDLTTSTGLPTLAAYPTFDSISPEEDIFEISGLVNATNLIVSALPSATSVSIEGGYIDISPVTSLQVTKHSRIIDSLVVDEINASDLKIDGISLGKPFPSIQFGANINSLQLLWKGYDESNNVISNTTPDLPEISPTDPFNIGVDINLIQILNHPTQKDIGIILYQDLISSNYYLKAFKYVYETGFDNTYMPYLISGADSSDIRITFATSLDVETQNNINPHIFIVGGKSTPGTSIYCGVVSVNTTTLSISDSGLFAWADTGLTTTNNFVNLVKLSDLKVIYSDNLQVSVAFDTQNLIVLAFDLSTQIFGLDSETINSLLVSTDYDYHKASNSTTLIVVTEDTIYNVGPGTDFPIPKNNFSILKKSYAGTDRCILTLFKAEGYKGFGGETFPYYTFSSNEYIALKSNQSYEAIPFQTDFDKTRAIHFEIGDNRVLLYKSYGYYILFDKNSAKFIHLGRVGATFSDVFKNDLLTICINNSTILRYNGTNWEAVKFLTDGPYLAYKTSNGNKAIIANNKTTIETSFTLEAGKTYYFSYYRDGIGVKSNITTDPLFAAKKLGVALNTNTFYVDME